MITTTISTVICCISLCTILNGQEQGKNVVHGNATHSPKLVVKRMTIEERKLFAEMLWECRACAVEAIDKFQSSKHDRRRPELANSLRYWQNVRSTIDWLLTILRASELGANP